MIAIDCNEMDTTILDLHNHHKPQIIKSSMIVLSVLVPPSPAPTAAAALLAALLRQRLHHRRLIRRWRVPHRHRKPTLLHDMCEMHPWDHAPPPAMARNAPPPRLSQPPPSSRPLQPPWRVTSGGHTRSITDTTRLEDGLQREHRHAQVRRQWSGGLLHLGGKRSCEAQSQRGQWRNGWHWDPKLQPIINEQDCKGVVCVEVGLGAWRYGRVVVGHHEAVWIVLSVWQDDHVGADQQQCNGLHFGALPVFSKAADAREWLVG